MDKQGDYKWGIMMALFLGLMVLSVTFSLFYREAQAGSVGDMAVCRESIQARSVLPDAKLLGFTLGSFKDMYPLKCKTMVVEIKKSDIEDDYYKDKIAGAMAECWALYNKGDASAFPSKFFKSSVCVPCARIHLTDKAKEYMNEKKMVFNIREILDARMGKGYSYWMYLRDAGKKFSAFGVGSGIVSNITSDNFSINRKHIIQKNILLTPNRLEKNDVIVRVGEMNFPAFFYPDKGDLLINYGVTSSGGPATNDYVPYLFYFQVNQKPNPFNEVKKDLFSQRNFCESWEGIPA